MKKTTGFTLVELLITIAVVTVLTTLVYPSLQESMRQSRRSDAHSSITELYLAQEKLRGSCKFYAQAIGANDVCGASAASTTLQGSAASRQGYYTLSIVAGSASGNSYTVAAQPAGDQVTDTVCSPITLTVNAANPRGLKGPADCW